MDKIYEFTFMLAGFYLFDAVWEAFEGKFKRLCRFVFYVLVAAVVKIAFKAMDWVIAL